MPLFSFKVTVEEARRIRAKAKAARQPSVSAYLRKSALGPEPAPIKIARRKHPVSGLPYNSAGERLATAEEIRSALIDFP